jgi:hypothetical protein
VTWLPALPWVVKVLLVIAGAIGLAVSVGAWWRDARQARAHRISTQTVVTPRHLEAIGKGWKPRPRP